jgi:hypothetical protein
MRTQTYVTTPNVPSLPTNKQIKLIPSPAGASQLNQLTVRADVLDTQNMIDGDSVF